MAEPAPDTEVLAKDDPVERAAERAAEEEQEKAGDGIDVDDLVEAEDEDEVGEDEGEDKRAHPAEDAEEEEQAKDHLAERGGERPRLARQPGEHRLRADEQLGVLIADADEELGREEDLVDEAEQEEAKAEAHPHPEELRSVDAASPLLREEIIKALASTGMASMPAMP